MGEWEGMCRKERLVVRENSAIRLRDGRAGCGCWRLLRCSHCCQDGEAACGGAWLCSSLGRGQREDLRTEVVTATVSGAWIPFCSPGGTKTSGCFHLASSIGAEQYITDR